MREEIDHLLQKKEREKQNLSNVEKAALNNLIKNKNKKICVNDT